MNSPHSSSQSATGESAAGSMMPPILLLVCGQMEDFSLRGEVGFRGEEVGTLIRPSLLDDCGHISVFLQAMREGSPVR